MTVHVHHNTKRLYAIYKSNKRLLWEPYKTCKYSVQQKHCFFGALYQVAHQLPLVFKRLKLPSPSIHKHTIQKLMKGFL